MNTIYLTTVYNNFVKNLGKETADNLVDLIDHKFEKDMENKSQNFATKEDLYNTKTSLTEALYNTRVELKEDIHNIRSELKEDIQNIRSELKEDIHNIRSELKEDIYHTRVELKEDIHNFRSELKGEIYKSKVDLIKWFITLWIALALMILGLYLRK